MKVTSERFIEVWASAFNEGRNIAWVARELEIDPSACSRRAEQMRRRGVKLPELAKHKASEATRLNQLLERKLKS